MVVRYSYVIPAPVNLPSHPALTILRSLLNGVTVNSYYKPPNPLFDLRSSATDTPLQVIIGDFNRHSTEWGYRSTNDGGNLVETWYDANSLTLTMTQSYPSCSAMQDGIKDTTHICRSYQLVLPISVRSHPYVTTQTHCNQNKNCSLNTNTSDWDDFAKSVDKGITDIVPTHDNYGSFEDPNKKNSKTEHYPWHTHKLYLWYN